MELFENHVLIVSATAWAIAQVLKVIVVLIQERKLDLWRLVSAGGMPSSHSALVSALATEIAGKDGVTSSIFALAVVFAAVVMYDAAGIRQAVSIQARILNKILDDYFKRQHWNEERLRELLGHTRIEVFAGAMLGIFIGIVWQ
ncbi:MAG TPA: divergent PAP2 family protein [Chloroflexota bacterium]|nr:divergent PAP2 family protein [Chloroflexota bacterium]